MIKAIFEIIQESIKILPLFNFVKKPRFSTKNVQHLKELDQFNIPNNKYIIGSSAALVACGLQHKPNRDIDICIEENYFNKMLKSGLIQISKSETGIDLYKLIGTEIDAGPVDPKMSSGLSFSEVYNMGRMLIDGYSFHNPFGCMKFYQALIRQIRRPEFQEKKKRQLFNICQEISKWFGGICYQGSPFQTLKDIRINRKIYNSTGLVYASYTPIFASLFGVRHNDTNTFHINYESKTDDGFNLRFKLIIKKQIPRSELDKPFSIYEISDRGFEHHDVEPIVELISKQKYNILKEIKYDSWLDYILALEKRKILKIINKENII